MSILITGFKGEYNSSKILIDLILSDNTDKLYLINSFENSRSQLEKTLGKKDYDFIFSFGQKPNTKKIIIELSANIENDNLTTGFEYNSLLNYLNKNSINTTISNNAGKYLCNNIYFHGLNYIKKQNKNTKIIFIHIPNLKNIADINYISKLFTDYINTL